jgi:ABC-type nitrate/sulfonate/bicarbonate transport system substrate-binding protein
MKGFSKFGSLIAAAAMSALASAAHAINPDPGSLKAKTKAGSRTVSADRSVWNKSRGPGYSYAHTKRMARKRRNVVRNRRAHRG